MSRGKRSRAHKEKRAAELAAAAQAGQPAPAPRPSGAARFQPSSNYLAHQHPPPRPAAHPYSPYPPQYHAPPPQHVLDDALAGLHPHASSSSSHFDPRLPPHAQPPAPYGYPPPRSSIAYYGPPPPQADPDPSRSSWPPPVPYHYPPPDRAVYGQPTPVMPPAAYPPSHSTPPTYYPPESPQTYARAPPQHPPVDPYRPETHLREIHPPSTAAPSPVAAPPSPPAPRARPSARPPPPPPPAPAPLAASTPAPLASPPPRAPFSLPPSSAELPVSSAPPARAPSPTAAPAPPARPVPSRAPPTPAPPPPPPPAPRAPSPPPQAAPEPSPPAPIPPVQAPASPKPLSAVPAALRASNMSTPISAAHDFVAFPPPSSATKPERDDVGPAFGGGTSDAAHSSSSGSENEGESSDGGDDRSGTDSEDEARVASALVGSRRTKGSRPPRDAGAPLFRAHSASSSDDDSDDESRSVHELQPDDDADDSDAIVDLEEAVQEQVDDDDDHDLNDASLAFDLGSASDGEGEGDSGGEDDAVPDDSLEHAAYAQRRKRRRVGSAGPSHADDSDEASSRAVSLDPISLVDDSDDNPSPTKRTRLSRSPPHSPTAPSIIDLTYSPTLRKAPAPTRAAALASHAFSTSTPSRLSSVLTAPAPSSPAATGPDLLMRDGSPEGEDEDREEGELPSDAEGAAAPHSTTSPALARSSSRAPAPGGASSRVEGHGAASALLVGAGDAQVAVPVGGAAGQLQLALPDGGGEVTYSGLGQPVGLGGEGESEGYDDGDRSVDMDMSFADLPADLLADLSRRAGGAISIPVGSSTAATRRAHGRRVGPDGAPTAKLDLSSTPVGADSPELVLHSKPPKLSYKPSPLAQPPVALVDPSAAVPAPEKGVYIRRQPVSTVASAPTDESTPTLAASAAAQAKAAAAKAKAAAAKAVYERPASAAGSTASTKQRTKSAKPVKPPGQLPLTRDEKLERLPPKIYTAFGDFESAEAAADPAIWSVPHHAVHPGRNLPPPNEACTHGFWPGPPSLKLGKAVFPAPPEPVDAVADLRPRVDVFIDNSNVLYSFLNWVRARPDVKMYNKALGGGGGGGKGKDGAASKAKQIKVITIGGKKVCLDYQALFALIERGRKVERRVLVGSSTLWQTLEPAVEWGYEVSLLQRVPRTEPSTSAATVTQVAQAPPPPPPQGKKRGKNGKVKQQQQQPQPVVAQAQNSGLKHFKEQAVDELVHLKILETLLDYTPDPLPPPSPRLGASAPQLAPAATRSAVAMSPASSSTSAPVVVDDAVAAQPARPADLPVSTDPSSASAPSMVDGGATDSPLGGGAVLVPVPTVAGQPVEPGADVEIGDPVDDDAQPAQSNEAGPLADRERAQRGEREDHVEHSLSQPGAIPSVAEPSAHPPRSPSSATGSAPTAVESTGVGVLPEPDNAVDAPEAAAPVEPTSSAVEAPVAAPAKSRFAPSQAFLSGVVQPAKPITPEAAAAATAAVAAVPRPASGASKFTPAAPKPAPAPRPPSRPAQGTTLTPVFAPRILEPRTRPTLVIVTGDANSSEYNPGGFLGCVRRALDRGWDVEVYAFTHGISSLWSGEQQIKVTRDGRRRGELRVVDLAQFGEELVL
ncbi:hypothetical protein JCM8208_001226 [Rhodotorula glutinis]